MAFVLWVEYSKLHLFINLTTSCLLVHKRRAVECLCIYVSTYTFTHLYIHSTNNTLSAPCHFNIMRHISRNNFQARLCIRAYVRTHVHKTYVRACVRACVHTYISYIHCTHTLHTCDCYTYIHTYIHTYLTLHYTKLHYIMLHYITLNSLLARK